eukprot:Hpha_TRINITY_DN15904_c1_g1::TRINITY_DN15904_c1_g1_i9::g.74133::m.74133
MNFVMSVAGMLVSAVAQQHATTFSVAGEAPLKGFGTCSDEEQALSLMRFARNITPLPAGWGTVPLCGGAWSGVSCTEGCVTKLYLSDSQLSGTADLSALPSGLQILSLAVNQLSGTPNLSALPSGLQYLDLAYNQLSGTPN